MSETSFHTRPKDKATRLTRRTFLGGITVAAGAAAWRFAIQPRRLDDTPRGAPAEHPQALPLIGEWGPQSTLADQSFNLQADGSSAFWFRSEGAPPGLQVVLGSYSLETKVHADLITASLSARSSAEQLSQAGIYPVSVTVPGLRTSQLVGYFHIFPKDADEPFSTSSIDLLAFETVKYLDVSGWGPLSTRVNQAFNEQRDGRSAFWVRCSQDLPAGAFLALDGTPLLSSVNGALITAGIFSALAARIVAQPGSHTLQLVDPVNRRVQKVGDFQVEEE